MDTHVVKQDKDNRCCLQEANQYLGIKQPVRPATKHLENKSHIMACLSIWFPGFSGMFHPWMELKSLGHKETRTAVVQKETQAGLATLQISAPK